MDIIYNKVLFVIGNMKSCYVFHSDHSIEEVKLSIKDVKSIVQEYSFIQINNYTLINTKYFIEKQDNYKIKMKDHTLHQVFRRRIKEF